MISEKKKEILNNLLLNLSKEEIIWLNGFLAAKSESGLIVSAPITNNNEPMIKEISIIYATETGNAKKIANNLNKKFKDLKIKTKIKSVDQYNLEDITKEQYLIFIAATHGEGEFSETANEFWSFLISTKPDLVKLKYAIIGLGDSDYPLFCEAARKLERKFVELGASLWYKSAEFDLDFLDHIENYYQGLKESLFVKKKSIKQNYSGKIIKNVILNDDGSNKEIHHVEIKSDAEFQAGDSIGIKINNNAPRLYSISSAPEQGKIALTVKHLKDGLCSPLLANLTKKESLDFYIAPNNNFKLPEGDKDIIMVGAGTGIAPFRSFLEKRDLDGATGKNWLFFGEQYAKFDFLYQTELQDYLESELLTKLDLAFSRDQEQKIYVQDRITEKAEELKKWLENGAYFYICGDKSKMAKDVEAVLVKILGQNFLNQLIEEDRYLKDVY